MPPVHALKAGNPFETFFHDAVYLEFKNYLYTFIRRKEAIRKELTACGKGLVLEIGSGISPIVPASRKVIYTDISSDAMRTLRTAEQGAKALTMSCVAIPFQSNTMSTIVCSEVLEHIREDGEALREIERVLMPGGDLILTVPIHPYFFSYDDRFVKHYRRYDMVELLKTLKELGFSSLKVIKLMGGLQKVVTIPAIFVFQWLRHFNANKASESLHPLLKNILPFYKWVNRFFSELIKWEASITPRALTTVILIHGRKASSD